MTESRDRAVILRRRARFVGAAVLALSGCGAGQEPVASPAEIELPKTGSEGTRPETESVPARAETPSSAKALPPLDVPADADGIARSLFEALAKHVPPIHAAIDRLEAAPPATCDLADASCERSWREHAARLEELEADAAGLRTECPGSSEIAERYAARVEAHVAHIGARLASLERAIEQAFTARGASSVAAWRALRTSEQRSEPMVCLDCANW